MQYYFVVGTTSWYHGDVTWREINNYINNISGIMCGLLNPHINMTIIDQYTDSQQFVYHSKYTNVSYTSNTISVVTLNGEELENGTVYLLYELTYSNLDFYRLLSDADLDTVRSALLRSLAEVE